MIYQHLRRIAQWSPFQEVSKFDDCCSFLTGNQSFVKVMRPHNHDFTNTWGVPY